MSTITRKKVDKINEKQGEAANDAVDLVHKIMHLIRSAQYGVLRDGGYELTHMEGKILGCLAKEPGTTLSDLVGHFGRDKGQLARVIKALRKQGLIETQEDPSDRRSVRLQLTAKGAKIHTTLRQQFHRVTQMAFRAFSAEEQTRLVQLLDRVRTNLEDDGARRE